MYNLRCTRYNLGEGGLLRKRGGFACGLTRRACCASVKGSPAAHVKGLRGKREGFAGGSREGLARQA